MLRNVLLSALIIVMAAGSAFAAGKKISVAGDCTWPPMEYLDAKKNPVGFSFDYIRAMAKEAGFEAEIRNVAWDGIFAGVAAGNYDVVSSSVTITKERQKVYDFSEPYYEVHQALVVPANSSIKTLQDLKGKKVGGQIGTTGIFVTEKAKVGAIIKEYEDVGLAMEDMVNGRIDAVMCDDPVAAYYANRKTEFANKIRVALKTDEVEYYGFVVKKGNKEVLDLLNKGIRLVKEKGIDKEIAKAHLGENIFELRKK